MAEYRIIPLEQLQEPPAPVRAAISEEGIVELAESIKQVGILQPLIVVLSTSVQGDEGRRARDNAPPDRAGAPNAQRPGDESAIPSADIPPVAGATLYEIVAGHRRYLAARYIRLEELPCIVYESAAIAREAVMLHENIYRVDLTPAEEGLFYAELIEKHDLTEDALSRMVRQKPSYIYDRLDLVRGDPEILRAVMERRINFSVAKELNKCDDPDQRKYFFGLAETGGATTATVRQWIAKYKVPAAAPDASPEAPAQRNSEPAAQAPGLCCWLCGRGEDAYNLRLIYLHFYELDVVRKLLEQAGVQVSATAEGD